MTKEFERDFPFNSVRRSDFEHSVEMDYIRNVQSDCEYQEKQMWKRVMVARKNTDPAVRQKEVERSKSTPRKACEKLDAIKQKHGGLYKQAYSPFEL